MTYEGLAHTDSYWHTSGAHTKKNRGQEVSATLRRQGVGGETGIANMTEGEA